MRDKLLASIAATIADYRAGEIAAPTPGHVDRWVQQFDGPKQEPILTAMSHVLDRTYFSKENVGSYLRTVLQSEKIGGASPKAYWEGVHFLSIQQGGASQREMLDTLDGLLLAEYGLKVADCGKEDGDYVYLDDGIFTGNRLRNDLVPWIRESAPQKARVHIVVMALHTWGALHYAQERLRAAAKEVGKEIEFRFWSGLRLEDQPWELSNSDVLRPTTLPDDDSAKKYAKMLTDAGHPPTLRHGTSVGAAKLFASSDDRILLEQQLLPAGLHIRDIAPNLKDNHRPLGYSVLRTLGFGALVVTFRNCPNNCPLAFWAGDPWYPLFPRKVNRHDDL